MDTDCKESSVEVGIQWGPLSLSATPKICHKAVVRRTVLEPDRAWWKTDNVANTPKWDVFFAQKVRASHGRPNFRVGLDVPHYYLQFPKGPVTAPTPAEPIPGQPQTRNFYSRYTQEHYISEVHSYTWPKKKG